MQSTVESTNADTNDTNQKHEEAEVKRNLVSKQSGNYESNFDLMLSSSEILLI